MSSSNKSAKSFSVGQRVRWSSMAGGHSTVKEGEIVVVVPAGQTAERAAGPSFPWKDYAVKAEGRHRHIRSEFSYMVRVPQGSSKKKDWLYWPRTLWLEEVP